MGIVVRGLIVAGVLSLAACGGGGTLTGTGGMVGRIVGAGGVGASGASAGGVGASGMGASGVVSGIAGVMGGGGGSTSGTAGRGWQCGGADIPAQALRPRVVVVLDAAQSMNDDMNALVCSGGCGQRSKWAAAASAINAAAVQLEPRAMWGLELFGVAGIDVCGTWTSVSVAPLPGSSPAIARALLDQSTTNGGVEGGGTVKQTRGAVDAAMKYAQDQADDNDTVIVVMTDGVPSCAIAGAPAADDTLATVDVITRARTAGYPTFVIGIATAGGPAHDSLNMMGSAAGGVGFNSGGDGGGASYFAASTATELRSALLAVVDMTGGGCLFEVPPPPSSVVSRSNISLSMDGIAIPRDTTHVAGWDFVSAAQTAVRLYGPPCDAARSARVSSLAVAFRCLLF